MKQLLISFITTFLMIQTSFARAENNAINILEKTYQTQGAKSGNAKSGEILWNKTYSGKAPFTERSCKLCHTAKLKNNGEHIRTGKILKPLAPSINPSSLSKVKKIKKWFKRNCKWTTGKECSVQDKADILAFIKQQ
ncbi:MAG: DUF1924 domain-containing protein [Woeseiaceae bacterium]